LTARLPEIPEIRYYASMAEKKTGRVEAFSDGVFAIADTLMILEIKCRRCRRASFPGTLLRSPISGRHSSIQGCRTLPV